MMEASAWWRHVALIGLLVLSGGLLLLYLSSAPSDLTAEHDASAAASSIALYASPPAAIDDSQEPPLASSSSSSSSSSLSYLTAPYRFLTSLLHGLAARAQLLEPTPLNAVFFFFACALTCSPLSFGYALVVLSCGAIFGMPAFFIVWSGSVAGASLWFTLVRLCNAPVPSSYSSVADASSLSSPSSPPVSTCCSRCLSRLPVSTARWSESKPVRAFSSSLAAKPFLTATLLQFTFLPFGFVTASLALTSTLSFSDFFFACCVSRIKLVNYVWLAHSVKSAGSLWASSSAAAPPFRIHDYLSLIVSLSLTLLSFALIAYFSSRQLQLMQEEQDRADTIDANGKAINELTALMESGTVTPLHSASASLSSGTAPVVQLLDASPMESMEPKDATKVKQNRDSRNGILQDVKHALTFYGDDEEKVSSVPFFLSSSSMISPSTIAQNSSSIPSAASQLNSSNLHDITSAFSPRQRKVSNASASSTSSFSGTPQSMRRRPSD